MPPTREYADRVAQTEDRISAFFDACELWIEPECGEYGFTKTLRRQEGQFRAGQEFGAPDLRLVIVFEQLPQNWCSCVRLSVNLAGAPDRESAGGQSERLPWVPDAAVFRALGLEGMPASPLPLEPTSAEVESAVEEAAGRLRRLLPERQRVRELLEAQMQRYQEAGRAGRLRRAVEALPFYLRPPERRSEPGPIGWVDFAWSREDYIATAMRSVGTAHAYREVAARMRRLALWRLPLGMIVVGLIIGLGLKSLGVEWAPAAAGGGFVAALSGIGAGIIELSEAKQMSRLRRVAARAARAAAPGRYSGIQRLTIDSRGVLVRGSSISKVHPWSTVDLVEASDAHVVIDTARGSILVPRTAFPRPEDVAKFLSVCNELRTDASQASLPHSRGMAAGNLKQR